MRTADRVIVFAVEQTLEQAKKAGDRKRHHEIHHADDEIGFENRIRRFGCDRRLIEEFGNADHVQYGRIFDVDHKLVGNSGKNISHYLRDHHVDHGLEMRHTDRFRPLVLSFIDGNDTAAHDFRNVCARVDGNDQNGGRKQRQGHAAGQESVSPVDHHRLNHHRGAAENFDITAQYKVDDTLQYFHPRFAGKRDRSHDTDQNTDQ